MYVDSINRRLYKIYKFVILFQDDFVNIVNKVFKLLRCFGLFICIFNRFDIFKDLLSN